MERSHEGCLPKFSQKKSLAETNQRNLQTLWGNQATEASGWYFMAQFGTIKSFPALRNPYSGVFYRVYPGIELRRTLCFVPFRF